MKNPWVIIGIIVVVLIGGSVLLSNASAKKSNEGVEVGTQHFKGSDGAKVTLVEYSDFQCPACQAFEPAVARVLTDFGGDIQFEYKHFPLPIHPFAEQAARAAEAAGQQNKFFEFHDKLFAGQKEWSNSPNPSTFFIRYADELGLDADQFKRQMKSTLLRDEVKADREAAMALGLTGTPTFFLNGEKMTITSYDEFYNQIAAAVNPNNAASTTTSTSTSTGSTTEPVISVPEVKFGI